MNCNGFKLPGVSDKASMVSVRLKLESPPPPVEAWISNCPPPPSAPTGNGKVQLTTTTVYTRP